MKSFKLSGQSRVSDIFGLQALDHLLPFFFIFIFVSLFLLIPKLGLDHGLALQRVAHTIKQTKTIKTSNT